MARTRYLSGEELEKLRSALRQKFRTRNPYLKGIPSTTYKEAYDDLRQDIIAVVAEAQQSVSLTRLRKLFYYTDPAACDAGQLENPSFGKDFLIALDSYISNQPDNKGFLPAAKYRVYGIALASMTVIGIALWALLFSPAKTEWTEPFDDLNTNRLKREGWEIWDFDSVFWRRQPRPGMLALYTLPGDYWVKPSEPRLVRNLLIHPLGNKNVNISTRLIDFFPTQNHQQAGFILFNKDKSRVQHLRAAYGFSGPFADPPAQALPGHREVVVLKINDAEQAFLNTFPVSPATTTTGLDTVYLHLSVRGSQCSVYYKSGFSWNQYSALATVNLDFRPAYVGLAAFQGWTRDDRTPKGADTIPVFFDWVTIKGIMQEN